MQSYPGIIRRLAFAALVSVTLALMPVARAADAQGRDATTIINGMRLKRMTQELKLTEEQQKKVKTLLDEEGKQVTKVQDDSVLTLSDKYDKQVAIKAETRKKMNEVFTEEQRKRWDELTTKTKKKPATPKPTKDKSAQ